MLSLGLEPEAAGWKVQTDPLSYTGHSWFVFTLQSHSASMGHGGGGHMVIVLDYYSDDPNSNPDKV